MMMMMFVSFNSNTMCATSEAGTFFPFKAHVLLYIYFFVDLFVIFLLAIVLSVLGLTTSDINPFGIFKISFCSLRRCQIYMICNEFDIIANKCCIIPCIWHKDTLVELIVV